MKTAIVDIETTSLFADTSILLCAVIKEYGQHGKSQVFRADKYPTWKKHRSNCKPIVKDVIEALLDYDIVVAHNGQWFDKPMLVSWALKYGLRVDLRFCRCIDPLHLARRHMRISRRSLGNVLQFLGIQEEKTPIKWAYWMESALDGNSRSLNYIVEHCVADVQLLERAYDIVKKLVKGVDEKGSSF